MKDYSDKYTYHCYINGKGQRVVIARSTYEGKTVKGIAKCDPADTYDEESGKKLAAARCNKRICLKREIRASRKVAEAKRMLEAAEKHYEAMQNYYNDAYDATSSAIDSLHDILISM